MVCCILQFVGIANEVLIHKHSSKVHKNFLKVPEDSQKSDKILFNSLVFQKIFGKMQSQRQISIKRVTNRVIANVICKTNGLTSYQYFDTFY